MRAPSLPVGVGLVAVGALALDSARTTASAAVVQLKDPSTVSSFFDELYEIISPDLYNIRLFHRDGWTGSRTVDKLRNESQALVALSTPSELVEFTATQFDAPKAVFINNSLLEDPKVFNTLQGSGQVSAVLLEYVNTTCETLAQCPSYDVSFAPPTPLGAGTPSAALNPYPDHVWVPSGVSTVMRNFSFPIFRLPDQESSDFAFAKASANVFSQPGVDGTIAPEWPYVAGEPHLYFGPDTMTSDRCLEMSTIQDGKKYCDPLGGQSVWAVAQDSNGATTSVSTDNNIILVAAAMDTRNLLQVQPGLGADQTVSALVALLVAADAVSGIGRAGWDPNTRVIFAGFEAERYGFIGSRRFINDLFTPANAPNIKGFGGFSCEISSTFNNATQAPWCVQPYRYSLAFQDIDPLKISHIIAVDGVGTGSATDIYIHSPTTDETFGDQVRENANKAASLASTNVHLASASASVPPTPLSSAIEAGLPFANSVTITGYDQTFSNVNYMGPGDVLETLDQDKIAAAAVTVVEAVLAAVGVTDGSLVTGAAVNTSLVQELVVCFLRGPEDDGCTLYNDYAYIYPSYDRGTLYSAAPTSWIGSPSTPYGTYTLYTGTFQPPYFYRAGEGWDASYTQVNWLHRVGPGEFVPFDESYEYNSDTDSFNVPTVWHEYFVWNFLADRFGEEVAHDSASGASTAECDSYADCGDVANTACINGRCKLHFTFFHDAVSTAVTALDYEVYEVDQAVMYADLPIYTEPVWGIGWWDTAQVRLFIPANPVDEWALFGIGVVVLVASTLFTYFKLPQILTRTRVILE